jgi:hypothetical protein
MNQYFFKMSKAEKNDILDKHRTIYDGYVTEYGKTNNEQPLYVQDFANDKNGITVSNTGNVKHYTNMNINEDIDRRDRIGDGPYDLEGGTVDMEGEFDMIDVDREYFHDKYPSPNEDEFDYVSLGIGDECKHCEEDSLDIILSELDEDFEFDIDRDFEEDLAGPMNYEVSEVSGDSFRDRVDDDELPDFMEKLNESLDMFKRFKRYN